MRTNNLKEQVKKKQLLSDFYVDFQIKEEKNGSNTSINDKHLNHILFLLEGEINISYNEFKNHLCMAGEMVFIPQDSDAMLEGYTDVKYIILSFNNQIILHEELDWNELKEFESDRDIFHKLDIRQLLSEALDSIIFYQGRKIVSSRLNEAKEKEIFLILKSFYSKQELARFIKPLLKEDIDFKAYIINNYTNAKNVDDLAQLCNMSIRAFTRKFKSQFDDSPYRWILRQRANQIKVLLADKKIPMLSIIEDYGFSSPAHFTTYCKKQFGTTPSSFRNSFNGKPEKEGMPEKEGRQQKTVKPKKTKTKLKSPASKKRHVDSSETK